MDQLVQVLLAKGWTPGATGIWLIAGLIVLRFLHEWRETRKLSLEDRLARREGYEKQVQELLKENRALRQEVNTVQISARKEIADVQDSFDDYRRLCRLETDQLREEIRELQDQITGMKRQEAGVHASLSRRPKDAQL